MGAAAYNGVLRGGELREPPPAQGLYVCTKVHVSTAQHGSGQLAQEAAQACVWSMLAGQLWLLGSLTHFEHLSMLLWLT